MTLYAGIDLHSNNSYVCVIDEQDTCLLERRFRNDATVITGALARYRDGLQGVAVESTFYAHTVSRPTGWPMSGRESV